MNIEDALKQISQGNCVLFVGSGFSLEALNIIDSKVPGSRSLISHFLDIASITTDRDDYDLETSSQEAFGTDHLSKAFEYLGKVLRCKEASSSQKNIINNPWRRIYTTNYDDVIETGAKQAGRPYNSVTVSDPIDRHGDIMQVVHIHGSIANLTKATFRSDFYLTDEQGLDIRFSKSHWNTMFMDDLVFSSAVFYVGFSNSDFHIRKLISNVTHTKGKTFFIVGESFSKPNRLRIERHGAILPIGVDGFASKIAETDPALVLDHPKRPDCLIERRYENVNASISPTREQVLQEFLIGSISPSNFTALVSPDSSSGMYIDRVSERLFQYIESPRRVLIVHSDIGNGKSVIINHYCAKIQAKYDKIFYFNGRSYNVEDVRAFLSSFDRCAVIIENISLSLSFAKLVLDASKNHVIIASDRTKRLEIFYGDIKEALGIVSRVDVDILSPSEIKRFVDFLDANILWGDAAGLESKERKIEFVRKKCASEVRGILFALFEGGAVRTRIEEIFNEFDSLDQDYRDLIILVCLLNFAYTRNDFSGFVYSYEDLLDLRIDFDAFSQSIRSKNISEFLNSEKGYFYFKSSTFAKYYLNKRVDIDYVFALVLRVLENLEKTYIYGDRHLYRDFSKALMQFNLYREIYSRNDARDGRLTISRETFFHAVYGFYDKCRHLKITHQDPLFVIQMSMAELDRENFEECYYLINTAEKMCDSGYDKYQIETHKADVIIKKGLAQGLSEGGLEEEKAFKLLNGIVTRRRERYHPFGVMDALITLYERSTSSLSLDGKKRVRASTQQMIKLCKMFPDELRERYHIISRVHARAEKLASDL